MQPEEFTLDYFLEVGVLTGSRAFGVAKPDSDWDIIIYESQFKPSDKSLDKWAWKLPPWEYMDYYEVCIDFTSDPSSSDADGVEDTDYIPESEGTVWGHDLLQIVKIWNNPNDEDECINLFIYDNQSPDIHGKFTQLNATMNFTLTKEQLADRDLRVERFAQLLKKFDIGDQSDR